MTTYVYVPIMNAENLLVYELDTDSGQLTQKHDIHLGKGGFPVCADLAGETLYAGFRAEEKSIGSYRIDRETGGLTPLGEVPVEGVPCYLSPDRSGRYLFSAYYSEGLVLVHEIGSDGALKDPPVDRHETEKYAHYIATDASNTIAFVPHVESANCIYQFHFDAGTGKLTPNESQSILACSEGHGPRHLAFHPELDLVYADNEQGSSVTAYRLDRDSGTLEETHTVSTLPPEGFDGENSNAQLHLHPNGGNIYASNRGHDSIAMFALDPATGEITSLGQHPGEEMPRPFAIEPGGRIMIAGGDRSKRLTTYRIDDAGRLHALPGTHELAGNPGWIFPIEIG